MTLTKEIWRQRWLSSINELTSLDLQVDTWYDMANTNPHWSYVEFWSCYFYDVLCDFDYQYYIDKNWVTRDEYELIKEWHNDLAGYKTPNNYDHLTILNDIKWIDILKKGMDAKKKLKELLPINEKAIFKT
jgi:hypothetical protein